MARRRRSFKRCINGDNCAHPRQGKLTQEDYTCIGVERWKKICNICLEGMVRKIHTCARGEDCINPKQGELSYMHYDTGSDVCRLCRSSTKSFEQVVNGSEVQRFLCGRIGHAATSRK